MASLTPSAAPAPRRPLVGVALMWTAGLGLAHLWPQIPPPAAMVTAGIAALLAAALARRGRGAVCLVHVAVLSTAISHGLLARPEHRPDTLAARLLRPAQFVELTLRLDSPPVRLPGEGSGPSRWRCWGIVEAIRSTESGWQSASGRVEVWMATEPTGPQPAYGDRWRVGAVARRGEDGRLRLSVRGPADLLARNAGSRWRAWCYAQRERARAALRRGIEDWTGPAEIIPAMVLGYREEVLPELRERFLRTGTAHIFAISGLHVGIFSVVLAAALRTVGCPRRWWGVALIPMLAVYTVATGASVSALRAFAIAAVWWLAPVLRRRPDLPSALAAAALAILGPAPSQIAEPGFWYSFLVVAGLAALTPPLETAARTLLGTAADDALVDSATPHWRSALRAVGGWLGRLAAASCAAWIASAPLTAHTGNQISPASLPGNLIVIPASFLIVLTGCISLVAGLASEALAVTFNHANAAICAGLVRAVDTLFELPGSYMAVTSPPLWAVLLIYAAITGLQVFEGRVRLALVGAAAAIAVAGATRYLTDDRARIAFAPADLAPAILLNVPGERGDWLIGPGPAWTAERLIRWLRSCGVDRLDAIVLPALDADHAGAAPAVLERIPTRRILLPTGRSPSPVARQLLERWAREGRELVPLAAGDTGECPGGIVWDVWHPPPGVSYPRTADGALWLRVARGGRAVLLAGRATPAQISSLTRIPVDPAASVVVLERVATKEDQAWLHTLGARTLVEHRNDASRPFPPHGELPLPP
ncbi:MAG: ComEC/Rec2 family competence protein [Kiritimatiellae bacterium]|nr:ComEC/Rec2 family competence protein [Kiritimatiellia bacterium]